MDRFPAPRFQPKERPQESAQYTGRASIDGVAAFVRNYRPQTNWTHDPVMRTLTFDGEGNGDGGRELKLQLNDLVAYLHGDLVVMPGRMFLPTENGQDS